MFESVSPTGTNTPATQSPAPPTTPLEIHSMPERFLGKKTIVGKDPSQGGKGSSKKLIIALGIIVVVALGVAAALMFTGVLNKNAVNTSNVNLVTNTPVSNLSGGAGSASGGNANANKNANANGNLSGGAGSGSAGNSNANSNLNVNAAANVNGNSNFNANANTNANVNVNANSNVNVNSNPAAKSSADADKDGLTDAEEVIFTTNPSVSDTDGDGFTDASEVKLGYNPKGSGKLAASGLVSTFTNALYGASVLYPKGWTIVARSSTEELISNPLGDETISFAVEDNIARLTAKQWYITKAPSVDPTTLVDATTWDAKSTGIISPDGLAYYFANGNQVFIISLSYGLKPTVDSRTTFEMLVRSLVVDPTKVNVNTNTANLNSNVNTALNTNTNANANSNLNSNANANKNSNTNSASNLNVTP